MLSGMLFLVFFSCVTVSPETNPAEPPISSPPEDVSSSPPEGVNSSPPEGVKVSGNLPVYTESELAAAEAERQSCISECIKANQMRAVSPQEIRVDCERSCDATHFIGQVEVIPDPQLAPPEPQEDSEASEAP